MPGMKWSWTRNAIVTAWLARDTAVALNVVPALIFFLPDPYAAVVASVAMWLSSKPHAIIPIRSGLPRR